MLYFWTKYNNVGDLIMFIFLQKKNVKIVNDRTKNKFGEQIFCFLLINK
jgi:hypothetical protein